MDLAQISTLTFNQQFRELFSSVDVDSVRDYLNHFLEQI
jgi:hypothetical protein